MKARRAAGEEPGPGVQGDKGPFPFRLGTAPRWVKQEERVARAPMQVAREGPCVPTVGVCRPLCTIQLVNCSRPIAAKRATEHVVLLFMMKHRGACRGLEWAERRVGWTAN